MKKFLIKNLNLLMALLLSLAVFVIFETYLSFYTREAGNSFYELNKQEFNRIDNLILTQKLNSLSKQLNWVCIKARNSHGVFFNESQAPKCNSTLFQRKIILYSPYASDLQIEITLRAPLDIEKAFILIVFISLSFLIIIIKIQSQLLNERKQNENTLIELARQFSHDIRSPLALLRNIDLNNFKECPKEYELLIKSINRIEEISTSMLKKSKAEFSTILNLNPIIDDFMLLKKEEFKNIEINYTSHLDNFTYCEIISNEFLNILSNLINNAVDAKKDNQTDFNINVFISKISEYNIQIEIQDNGIGMTESFLERINKKMIITSKINGNGIGLKNSFANLNKMGCKMEVFSKHLVGTNIIITIPIIDIKNNIQNNKKKIILVDNDELTKLNWEIRAKKANINISIFKNKTELFKILYSFPNDTIFYIDSELDDEKGEDLALELLKKGFKNINLTTGHPPEKFSHLKFLNTIIDKTPPF